MVTEAHLDDQTAKTQKFLSKHCMNEKKVCQCYRELYQSLLWIGFHVSLINLTITRQLFLTDIDVG